MRLLPGEERVERSYWFEMPGSTWADPLYTIVHVHFSGLWHDYVGNPSDELAGSITQINVRHFCGCPRLKYEDEKFYGIASVAKGHCFQTNIAIGGRGTTGARIRPSSRQVRTALRRLDALASLCGCCGCCASSASIHSTVGPAMARTHQAQSASAQSRAPACIQLRSRLRPQVPPPQWSITRSTRSSLSATQSAPDSQAPTPRPTPCSSASHPTSRGPSCSTAATRPNCESFSSATSHASCTSLDTPMPSTRSTRSSPWA